uniref:Uncharacterized protein n=1 Tax=Spongospora subterranea TaxID=70186 RepID=A0A0H5R8X6_9EUKA|eukprot:CRZ10167.1 hypothetical protein [Spongospora subterranea]
MCSTLLHDMLKKIEIRIPKLPVKVVIRVEWQFSDPRSTFDPHTFLFNLHKPIRYSDNLIKKSFIAHMSTRLSIKISSSTGPQMGASFATGRSCPSLFRICTTLEAQSPLPDILGIPPNMSSKVRMADAA